ncbi:MAG: ATP-dependent nuclease [Anaerolineae bacterium]
MKLRRLEIESFRGIRELDVVLGDTTVLIGENNSGKTSVLDALRFALRAVSSRRGCVFDAYDFHLPHANAEPASSPAISIRLTFREDAAGDWDENQLARLNRAQILQLDEDGRAAVALKVSAQYDPASREFTQGYEFQNLAGSPLVSVPGSAMAILHEEISYYYLAALRDAARQFDARGPFWRPFLQESQLTPDRRQEIEQKLSEVNQLIISSHASFSQVVSSLEQVQHVVAMTGGDKAVSIDAVPARLFEMLSKAEVNLNAVTGAKIPIERHGEGTQSLAVLTLFSAYLQAWNKGDAIVALEEPEAHLHPSAVRALWKLIEGIPGQKIISTHSGDLLSVVPCNAVIRLHRAPAKTMAYRFQDARLEPRDLRKFEYHIRRARGELLFSRCWILGEGETEGTLIPECARILGNDLEQAGIRFVPYGHVSLATYLKIANSLGIQWVVLADNDQQGANDHRAVRQHLEGRTEKDVLYTMPQANIEQYLCCNGFENTYAALLDNQSRQRVIAQPGEASYPTQVANALPAKKKVFAAQAVLEEIRNKGKPMPPLLASVIEASLKQATQI